MKGCYIVVNLVIFSKLARNKGKAYQMILPNQPIKNISWWCTRYGVIEISNFFYSHYLSFVKVSVIENCRCQSLDILI